MPLTPFAGENDRFHAMKSDYPDRSLSRAIESGTITEQDKKLILEFIAERKITNGIKSKRVLKIISSLITCRRFVGPYFQNTHFDIYQGIDGIMNGGPVKGGQFTQNTRGDLIMILKSFVLWMIDNEYLPNVPEKKIRAIKVPRKVPTKEASDLLSVTEIEL